ncbi:WSC-domain-containing protein [Phanerochaete sordida]|uniref:WSC-domain-containing protein n=1 Tax=Phanerochaete sordida TaxID=48140 RepID=A0A9P3G3I0_9APHY|nr:WSC-domain-containing protein [Phanerochaete sordida]
MPGGHGSEAGLQARASTLPPGWSLASPCSQDDGSRILYNDVITDMSDNTPAACTASCGQKGYGYAGVEYGVECHCGTGFLPGALDPIDTSECGTPCAGDASQTCGGSWTIQLYEGPVPTETFPPGWALVRFCAVDEANRVIVNDHLTVLSNNTPATCAYLCNNAGFTYAGVEYGDECHCGTGYTGGARAPTTDCNMPCSGDPGLTCGASWRIQIYSSKPQTSQ